MSGLHSRLSPLAALLGLGAGALAQPMPQWTVQFGSDSEDTHVVGAPGLEGDLYTFGKTRGNLGGPHVGGLDCFLTRHDADGHLLWAGHLGTKVEEDAGGAAPDGSGGVFVTGMTRGDLGGPTTGKSDVFLARYDPDGSRAWLIQFGTPTLEYTTGAAPDGQGGVFVGGITSGSLFDELAGNEDVFVARFDHDGNLAWGVQFGTNQQERGGALAPDGAGGVLICGSTWGKLAGPLIGNSDGFVARFGADGQEEWIVQFDGSVSDGAHGVASDGAGGAFVAGSLWWPSAYDAFVARVDGALGLIWLRPIATPENDYCGSLIPAEGGGVIAGGSTSGDLDGPSSGFSDGFVARYDSAGNQDWLTQFGTPQDEWATVAENRLAGFFVVGATNGMMAEPDRGSTDVFIVRYGEPCAADCDGSGDLSLFDFLCFVNLFNAADPAADCDQNGTFDLFDFLCFVNVFSAGC